MKTKATRWLIATLILFLGLGSSSVKAQEWSKDQQEVWKNVNEYWSLMAKGDIEGFLGYFHDDYLGWSNDGPVPHTKDDSRKYFDFFYKGMKTPFYNITPVGIRVIDDLAVVHYYYTMITESADGKRKSEEGRWTDVLVKKGGKWVMIADHGGEEDDD